MKRFVLTALAVAALSAPAFAADCAKDYKEFWNTIDREQFDAEHYAKASDIFSSGAFAPPGARK